MRLVFDRVDGVGVNYLHTPNGDGAAYDWSVANVSEETVRMRGVSLVFRVEDVRGELRMFRHGFQSWSVSDIATFGVDVDPSTIAHNEFFQAAHHADQRSVTGVDELRSEWVTVLHDDDGPVLVGFLGGGSHDGTLRLRRAADGVGIEVFAEAYLGDAEMPPNTHRGLHPLIIEPGADETNLLDGWAKVTGATAQARVDAPYQVGWCSWYHYFDDITEDALRANLALAGDHPFEVFQLDDGFQSAIGDWLITNAKFPSGLASVGKDIAAAGYRPGIWIAPFLVAPDSVVATEHPEWLAKFEAPSGKTYPLRAWMNPIWGGGHDGYMYGLDTTNPEVLEHLAQVANALVGMGFTYLKLDFTFAPSMDGIYADPTKTPAERVRLGYAAIRAGAGNDAFLLGCGAPLSHIVGLVDGNRIGPDVAPYWELDPSKEVIPGYLRTQPGTRYADDATRLRAFMHRRLWLNDPDCLMLRTEKTALASADAERWARTVGLSGGMAIVSDDLALLDASAKRLLEETVALGRESDASTREQRCPLVESMF